MKIVAISSEVLERLYSHPSAVLFRGVELSILCNELKSVTFKQPSMDLGCGDGYISSLLFDQKFTYGIDNGEADDVEIAIKENRYGKVLVESAEKMSLESNSLAFVFSNSVIEHIPDNDAVLREVSRVLKKDGVFLFTSPSRFFTDYLAGVWLFEKLGLKGLAHWYQKKRNEKLNHYHLYDDTQWRKRLSKVGLKVISYRYYLSEADIRLWDTMALLVVGLSLIVGKNRAEQWVYRWFCDRINKVIETCGDNSLSKGGSVLIYAKKV